MIIRCATNLPFNPGQYVNKLGKYLYKHIDSAYKITFSANTCDIYMFIYYQEVGNDTLYEMHFDISITTYQNKLRMNIIEISPEERTIGHDTFDETVLKNFDLALRKMYATLRKRLDKAYQDYEFIY